jgi:hypothetical protein
MKVGDRVIIRASGSSSVDFLNDCRGTITEPGQFQFEDELTLQIDGRDGEYYIPAALLEPCPPEPKAAPAQSMPVDSAARKDVPVTTGVFDYFPAALAEVARVSKAGNDKHNPGEPLHWARGKSTDQADAIGRHLIDRGGVDPDTGLRHSGELAWRALALLQLELEEAGEAPIARGAHA